jgi:hypothetical protein
MSLPGVKIEILNGSLGSVPSTSDGIAGMILSGIAVTSKIALNEPKQLFSLADAVTLGLDAAYDTTNELDVYFQIKQFYDEAGTGSELWIMIVAQTVLMATMVDKTSITNAVKLLNAASGTIRLLGVNRTPTDAYTAVIETGLDDDVWDALTNAQALAEEYALKMQPFRAIIAGREWSGVAGSLLDLHTKDTNRVAIALTGQGDGIVNANIGIVLGRLASIPVQRNIGRVKNGALQLTDAYLTDGNPIEDSINALESIHNKGYIIFRRFEGKSGYYFNDDPTAAPLTDDYASIARGRVIDKAMLLAYITYVEEVNDDVEINTDGTLPAGYVKSLQAKIENVINTTMTAESEISSVLCVINPLQNILATNKLIISISIIPKGYTKTIEIELGFNNPLNS